MSMYHPSRKISWAMADVAEAIAAAMAAVVPPTSKLQPYSYFPSSHSTFFKRYFLASAILELLEFRVANISIP